MREPERVGRSFDTVFPHRKFSPPELRGAVIVRQRLSLRLFLFAAMVQRFSDIASYFSSLGLERSITAIGSLAGALWSFAFTEAIWPLVWWLAIFIAIDFATGWLAASKTGQFQSRVLRDGVLRKVLIITVCGLSHGLDVLFEPVIGVSIFQSMVICMYGLGEFASILENLERAGYGQSIPPILRRLIGALNHRLENTVETIEGDKNANSRAPEQ